MVKFMKEKNSLTMTSPVNIKDIKKFFQLIEVLNNVYLWVVINFFILVCLIISYKEKKTTSTTCKKKWLAKKRRCDWLGRQKQDDGHGNESLEGLGLTWVICKQKPRSSPEEALSSASIFLYFLLILLLFFLVGDARGDIILW